MKKWIVFVVAAFVLVSCNLPFTVSLNTTATPPAPAPGTTIMVVTATPEITAQPLPIATSDMVGVEKNLGGIDMKIPACLASDATGVIVPEENPGADAPVFAYTPEYRKITLVGYPVSGGIFDPIVQVFPVADYENLVPSVTDTVTQMQQILSAKPGDFQNSIPLLPIENAAQILRAQVTYLDFQNGSGVGFLTQYAQGYMPVSNDQLFYAYQGLTQNGKYWVSVLLSVNASFLQSTYNDTNVPAGGIPAPDINSSHLDTEFPAYYDATTQKLNSTSEDAFLPTLECIKSFVQSFNVGD